MLNKEKIARKGTKIEIISQEKLPKKRKETKKNGKKLKCEAPCLRVHLIELNDTINRCDIGQNGSFVDLHFEWKFVFLLVHTFKVLFHTVLVFGSIITQSAFIKCW